MRLDALINKLAADRRRPVLIPAALFLAVLISAGCAGSARVGGAEPGSAAPPAPPFTGLTAGEVLLPVGAPAWFLQPAPPDGRRRVIPGTGVSLAWSGEALDRAENDARNEAALIAGSLVRSEWRQRTREQDVDGVRRFEEEIDYLTRVFSEEPIFGAAVLQSEWREGKRLSSGRAAGSYYQGFVLLQVPEENFAFTAQRCLKQARAALQRDDVDKARLTLEGAALFWPDDPDILAGLALVQERSGLLGDAVESLRALANLVPAEQQAAVRDEIERIDRRRAGGEFACLEARLRRVVAASADDARLKLVPLGDRAAPGGFLDYTVRSDRAYAYYGLWIDADGGFTFPAHAADSGSRLGGDAGAALSSLDAGETPGPHLFVLVADAERRGWFEERSFPRGLVDRRAADGSGRLPHRDLAAVIADLEQRHAAGHLVAAAFSFDVER